MIGTIGAAASGSLFAVGLLYSGMSNPDKVQNFLDFFGTWDPSLAFVMAGAIAVAMPFFRYATTHKVISAENKAIKLPENSRIDSKLLIGAGLFGIGWGLAGVCPAPAFTLVSAGVDKGITFVLAMLVGVVLQGVFSAKSS